MKNFKNHTNSLFRLTCYPSKYRGGGVFSYWNYLRITIEYDSR